ncbi:MAG: type VI secretion system-associated FHA domain protein TagH [Thalassobaculaceae bacterium]|nr:type VI secretion system-associated FHA domain protein TagH [Thalassobaculaceae bacterium]
MRLMLDVTSFQKALMGSGSRHEFDETGGVIGRGRRSDWVLPDPDRFVSGSHAEISFDGDRFYITDVSTNGLFLNDSSVPLGKGARWPISNGDRMALGDFEILARIDEGADTPLPGARPAAPAPRAAPTPSPAIDIDSLLAPLPDEPDPDDAEPASGAHDGPGSVPVEDDEPAAIPPFPDPQVLAPPPRRAPAAAPPPAAPPVSAPPLSSPPPAAAPVMAPPTTTASVPPPPPRLVPRPDPVAENPAPKPVQAPPPVAPPAPPPGPQESARAAPTEPTPPPTEDASAAVRASAPSVSARPDDDAGDGADIPPIDHAAAIAGLDLEDLIGPDTARATPGETADDDVAATEAQGTGASGPDVTRRSVPIPPPPPALSRPTPAAPSVSPPRPAPTAPPPIPPIADIPAGLPDDIDALLGDPFDAPPAPPAEPAASVRPSAIAPPDRTVDTDSGGDRSAGPLSPGEIEAGLILPEGLSELERKARLWDEFTRVYNDLRREQ